MLNVVTPGKVINSFCRAEQSRAEQSKAEQSRAEQSRAEQSRAELNNLGNFKNAITRCNELSQKIKCKFYLNFSCLNITVDGRRSHDANEGSNCCKNIRHFCQK